MYAKRAPPWQRKRAVGVATVCHLECNVGGCAIEFALRIRLRINSRAHSLPTECRTLIDELTSVRQRTFTFTHRIELIKNILPPSSSIAQPSFLHHPTTTAESCDVGRLTTGTPPNDALPRQQASQFPVTTATSERCDAGPLTIDVLPDDVLLGIFAYYLSWKGSAWPT
jgi:hypothetical protein